MNGLIIASGNKLLPVLYWAIIRTSVDFLSIGLQGTNVKWYVKYGVQTISW